MSLTQTFQFHVRQERKGKRVAPGPKLEPRPGRVPRVAKLMALVIRLEGMVRSGEVESYTALARLGHVSTARITQILNLCNLAPDLQEELLHLPPVERGRDPIKLADLQPIAAMLDWRRQRGAWTKLLR